MTLCGVPLPTCVFSFAWQGHFVCTDLGSLDRWPERVRATSRGMLSGWLVRFFEKGILHVLLVFWAEWRTSSVYLLKVYKTLDVGFRFC